MNPNKDMEKANPPAPSCCDRARVEGAKAEQQRIGDLLDAEADGREHLGDDVGAAVMRVTLRDAARIARGEHP